MTWVAKLAVLDVFSLHTTGLTVVGEYNETAAEGLHSIIAGNHLNLVAEVYLNIRSGMYFNVVPG